MANEASLEAILEAIRSLSPAERRRLQRWLQVSGLLEKEDKDFPGIAMADTKETILHNLTLPQNASQQGIAEMFDATVGRTTVLLPYGGKTQRTTCWRRPGSTDLSRYSAMALR